MESDEFDLQNLREWQPIDDVFAKIPPKIQKGFFAQELSITCVDILPEYLALGSDVGIVFWYNRQNGNVQKLRTEVRDKQKQKCTHRHLININSIRLNVK